MTLRRRILTYYTCTLVVALGVVAFWSWFEFHEQREIVMQGGLEAIEKESPLLETLEIIAIGGLPALLVTLLVGHALIRRSLRPIEELTGELEKTDVTTLSQPVPRSGNGDELDRMAAVFNGMKERLGASFTQAREFTLHASHELKTPLTILHGTLEQALNDSATPPLMRERMSSMLEEVQRLSGIVAQLAFLANADAGLMTVAHEEQRLDLLVREIVEDTLILAAGEAVTVSLSACERVTVVGDRMRLRQLLLNLADNAVKHNIRGGSVVFSLSRSGGLARVEIINTGAVLPPELRARVFERFFRGDRSHGSAVEGSGLGLSIAKSIARAHDGCLAMDETEDGRTCVTFTLPLPRMAV